jgi:hypothetical protein
LGNIRWDENKVAWSGFGNIFELVSPPHPSLATQNENNAFQCAVMMHTRFGVGLDGDRPSPDFLCSNTRMIDRCLTKHTWCLRGVGVELIAFYHTDPIVLPSI